MDNKITFMEYLANKLQMENNELRIENAKLEFVVKVLQEKNESLNKKLENNEADENKEYKK